MNIQRFAATLVVATVLSMANAARATIILSGLTATSNAPGTSIVEFVRSSGIATNTGTQTATITLAVGDTFSVLTTPPSLRLESDVTLDVVIASAENALSFISCIAPNQAPPNCSPGTIDTPALSPSITALGPTIPAEDDVLVTALLAPYALSHELILTLGAGAEVEFVATSRVLRAASVPEPSSLALLVAALLAVTCAGSRCSRLTRSRLMYCGLPHD